MSRRRRCFDCTCLFSLMQSSCRMKFKVVRSPQGSHNTPRFLASLSCCDVTDYMDGQEVTHTRSLPGMTPGGGEGRRTVLSSHWPTPPGHQPGSAQELQIIADINSLTNQMSAVNAAVSTRENTSGISTLMNIQRDV